MGTQNSSKDGGWMSRKLHLILFAIVLLTVVAFFTTKYTELASVYGTLCTTVIALCGLFVGGNAAVKWMYSRKASGDQTSEADVDLPTPPKT